jgi:glutathionyl-hydroquinone reductase
MRPVSNESSDIVRMLGQLQLPGASGVELYPAQLQQQIDTLNDKVGAHMGVFSVNGMCSSCG